MRIAFAQTADTERYLDMVLATSKTAKAYCAAHDFSYECYLGVKRGYWPWQSTFNRIYMLQELIQRGQHDWMVYLDADAFVADLEFDLVGYLEPKSHIAAILSPSGASHNWWDINAGVMIFNLRHPNTHRLADAWVAAYEAIPDETIREQSQWSNPNDQEMIQWFLRDNEAEMRPSIELAPHDLLNSLRASFIRQILRAYSPDLRSRTEAVRLYVDEVLGLHKEEREAKQAERRDEAEQTITALYLTILGRGPDGFGMAYYTDLMQHVGVATGALRLVADALQSDEYKQLNRSQVAQALQAEREFELAAVEAG
jgi:hypothetical protein